MFEGYDPERIGLEPAGAEIKLHLLLNTQFEPYETLGVFTSIELAEKYQEWFGRIFKTSYFHIEEVQVNPQTT